jgi:hypothetical protein
LSELFDVFSPLDFEVARWNRDIFVRYILERVGLVLIFAQLNRLFLFDYFEWLLAEFLDN